MGIMGRRTKLCEGLVGIVGRRVIFGSSAQSQRGILMDRRRAEAVGVVVVAVATQARKPRVLRTL